MGSRDDEWDDLGRRMTELEPRLVGLSIAEAEALVGEHAGLSIRFTANGVVTLDYVPGRIDAYVRDGVVVDRDTVERLPRVEMQSEAVVLHNLDGPVTWPDVATLARQYWAWQRHQRDEDFVAVDCIQDATEPLLPQWGALSQALVDTARDDTELALAGAALLEQALTVDPSGTVDELVARARRDARYLQALRSVYVGDDVPRDVVAKLRPLRE